MIVNVLMLRSPKALNRRISMSFVVLYVPLFCQALVGLPIAFNLSKCQFHPKKSLGQF